MVLKIRVSFVGYAGAQHSNTSADERAIDWRSDTIANASPRARLWIHSTTLLISFSPDRS